ncbi:MAG: formylglycine-generating enzyme family protein, partial [Candidatus Electrothrix sp. LOE2]|nr:formylglycine-generating enzyme family protein [Candidatus Electrothrix sp. LOE2]
VSGLSKKVTHLVAGEKAVCLLEYMQDLRMRPMLLQHIDKLLVADCRQDWNAYTVYEVLVDEWLDREVRKLREQHEQQRVPERKELFHACLRIAEQMERGGGDRRIISEDSLHQLIQADENIAWLEQFELGGRSLLNRNSDRAFRFSHYTVQEFLLAWGLVNEQLLGEKTLRATDQLVRFLVLAKCLFSISRRLDCSGFNWQGYVETYGPPSFQDQLSNGDVGPEMILLPNGCFQMQGIQGAGGRNERPAYEVELDSFSIGRYPVTFVEYDLFCEATGCKNPNDRGWGRGKRPVINVSWKNAVDYCKWLSRETGHTYRLPTEAEWEYACRAGSEAKWCFGDNEECLVKYAWYSKNSNKKTRLIGEKNANAWGLHDMHGNVREWCRDWFAESYYNTDCQQLGIVKNPVGPEQGKMRVLRGGSWNNGPERTRFSVRCGYGPNVLSNGIGFRVVFSTAAGS